MDNFNIFCYNKNMKIHTVHMDGMPKIWFAHTFSAPFYSGMVDLLPNTLEITYLKKGSLAYYDNEENHKENMTEGTIFINEFNNIKKVFTDGFHEHHTFSILYPPGTEENHTFSFSFSPKICDDAVCRDVSKLIDLLIIESHVNGENSLKCVSLIFRILEIIDSYSVSIKEESSYANLLYVKRAKKYIAENVNRSIRIDEIASSLNITPQYLCTLYRKATGTTIVNYINRLKLENIKNLVINNGLSIHQAGESMGLYDESYISRMFKKYYGLNLSELKKISQRDLKYQKIPPYPNKES